MWTFRFLRFEICRVLRGTTVDAFGCGLVAMQALKRGDRAAAIPVASFQVTWRRRLEINH